MIVSVRLPGKGYLHNSISDETMLYMKGRGKKKKRKTESQVSDALGGGKVMVTLFEREPFVRAGGCAVASSDGSTI